MKGLFIGVTGLILLILAIIGVQNPTLIAIHFLGWQTSALPLWVIMLAALVGGMLLVGLATMPSRTSRYRTKRRLRSQRADAAAHSAQPPAPANKRSLAPAQPDQPKPTP